MVIVILFLDYYKLSYDYYYEIILKKKSININNYFYIYKILY